MAPARCWSPDPRERSRWTAVNACLVPALALDGQEVVTAEGLGTPDDLHPVQREMADRGGSQCGYCPRASSAAWRRSTTGRGGGGDQGFDMHAIAATCAGAPATGRSATRPRRSMPRLPTTRWRGAWTRRHRSRWRPGSTGSPGPPISPRRSRCFVNTPTRPCSPAAPTGAWRSTSAVSARRTSWRSTGCPSSASSGRRPPAFEIGAALTLSEAESALAGRLPMLDEVFDLFASRLIRNGATIGGNLGHRVPDRRPGPGADGPRGRRGAHLRRR